MIRRVASLAGPDMSTAQTLPASIVADPRRKRWTVGEFNRLVKLNFFDEPVELVDGEILRSRPAADEDPQWLWTREAYYRLWERGLLPEKRLQLVSGEIYFMLPQNPPHAASVARVARLLERQFGTHFHARVQLPLDLGLRDDPEPDIAIVAGDPDEYAREHPRQAPLVVEISDSTLAFDRRKKGLSYARGGVADYWIVNLLDACLEVYRRPTKSGYKSCDVLEAGEAVSPLALAKCRIKIADLLP